MEIYAEISTSALLFKVCISLQFVVNEQNRESLIGIPRISNLGRRESFAIEGKSELPTLLNSSHLAKLM